jgi:calpain-15
MFKNSADPNDIHQGQLGDCYFLSSLASLAEYPLLAERLVEYEDNKNGFYGVWLCVDGEWKLITLDGWVIVTPNTPPRVAFSYSDDEELWVVLLEKAYAKAYGDYQHIAGGTTVEAIRDLTGAPGKWYNHTSKNGNKQIP